MTAAIAWAAFLLAVLELVMLAGVVVVAAKLWRQVAPQVGPLLAMFAPPPAPPGPPVDGAGP